MRWLSLIAVLSGCTLITDPDSFEGDPVDGGRVDADASDGGIDALGDAGVDAGCEGNVVDVENLRVCRDGMWIDCDQDGDGFVSEELSVCVEIDAERFFPPPDCNDGNPMLRNGLHTCGGELDLQTCSGPPVADALSGTNVGEIAFQLDLLTEDVVVPPPPLGSVELVTRGPGQYDMYYLDDCSTDGVPGCNELHRFRFTYQPPWRLTAEDERILTEPIRTGRLLALRSAQTPGGPVFALANLEGPVMRGSLLLFQDDFVTASDTHLVEVLTPFIAVDARRDTTTLASLEGPVTHTLHLRRTDEPEATRVPVRTLTDDSPHPLDVSGSHVVLLGDAMEQQYWAAPPLSAGIGGNCNDTDGCLTVPVGGSDPEANLQPLGPPSVLEVDLEVGDDAEDGIGFFPARTRGTRPVSSIYVQQLVPACVEFPARCTDPVELEATRGSPGNHDVVSVAGRTYLAYQKLEPEEGRATIELAVYTPTGLLTDTPLTTLPLFNDGLVDGFTRVDAIRLVVRQDDLTVEVAVLVIGEASGGAEGAFLNILRACDAF